MNTEEQEVINQAAALTIKTPATRQQAADLWDAVVAFSKQAEASKEEVIRPLKKAYDDAKKPYDDFIKECYAAKAKLETAMSAWDREQLRIAAEEQRKLQAKTDAQNAKIIANAEAKGQDISEVALKVAPVVVEPPKSIVTQAGTTQKRIKKITHTIKGIEKDNDVRADYPHAAGLLKQYPGLFALDWVAFRKIASTGMLDNVPGVEKTEEFDYRQGKVC